MAAVRTTTEVDRPTLRVRSDGVAVRRPSVARGDDRSLGLLALQRSIGNGAVGALIDVQRRAAARDVAVEFFPDEQLDSAAALNERRSTNLEDRVSGLLHVYVAGTGEVGAFPARGGPPGPQRGDGVGHTIAPTPAVDTKLAAGSAHISRVWAFSKIRNGTPLRDQDTTFQYWNGRSWGALWKLGIKRKDVLEAEARKEFSLLVQSGVSPSDFVRDADGRVDRSDTDNRTYLTLHRISGGSVTVTLPTVWQLNDFGSMAFAVPGTQSFIHTTPLDEEQFARGLPETLTFSHGCIHIRPSDREILTAEGWLQGGVRFVSHGYRDASEWGTPGTSTVPDRYRS